MTPEEEARMIVALTDGMRRGIERQVEKLERRCRAQMAVCSVYYHTGVLPRDKEGRIRGT